jgi:hypothetical protein
VVLGGTLTNILFDPATANDSGKALCLPVETVDPQGDSPVHHDMRNE